MQFCRKHWDQLRAAIDIRGLTPLVSKDGVEATRRAANMFSPNATDIDPLLAAHHLLVQRVIGALGLQRITDQASCPCCVGAQAAYEERSENPQIKTSVEEEATYFLESCAEAVLLRCQTLGLTPKGEGALAKYSCKGCGLVKREVRVRYRFPGEDVVVWTKGALMEALSQDHFEVSPECTTRMLSEVMIPITGRAMVGGPPIQ